MSGIKNIKKKLKGFQVRPPNAEVIKKVLLHIPYVGSEMCIRDSSSGQADGSPYELSVRV